MKNTILFYYSVHHGNTKKIVKALEARFGITLVRVPCDELPSLEAYGLVGFASGVYMSEFGKPLLDLANRLQLEGKDCFTLYTCGAVSGKYDGRFVKLLESKGANVVGRFHCRGYDTFGPFKLVGGIAKDRPDEADVADAIRFFEKL